ncbi:MAG: hypothetical protein ACK41Q_11050 [Candidatus Brocadia sp.]
MNKNVEIVKIDVGGTVIDLSDFFRSAFSAMNLIGKVITVFHSFLD